LPPTERRRCCEPIDRPCSGRAPAPRAACWASLVSRSGTRRCECRQTQFYLPYSPLLRSTGLAARLRAHRRSLPAG